MRHNNRYFAYASWRYQSIMIRLVTDYLHRNARLLSNRTALYVFEDNEALIKQMKKGRSATVRNTSRTHRVDLDWQCDRNNLDPMIQIKYVNTTQELADIPTKGSFTRDRWTQLTLLLNPMTHTTFGRSNLSVSAVVDRFFFSMREICQRIFRCICKRKADL